MGGTTAWEHGISFSWSVRVGRDRRVHEVLGSDDVSEAIHDMVSAPPAVLRVRGGPQDGRMIFLSPGLSRLGRAPVNEIVVDDPGVSREHATIRGDPSGYWISDLDSSNGTHVNGIRLGREACKLQNRDVIHVGAVNEDISLVFMRSVETVGA